MNNLDKDFITLAKEFLTKVTFELDEVTSVKGIIEENGSNEVNLYTPSYIQFAKYGRAAGKKPPLDPILNWVKSKGILFDGTTERGTAFAIQSLIGKRGTKNYVPNAPNFLEEVIKKNYEDYNKLLANSLSVSIDYEVNDIYKKYFPEKVEFKI